MEKNKKLSKKNIISKNISVLLSLFVMLFLFAGCKTQEDPDMFEANSIEEYSYGKTESEFDEINDEDEIEIDGSESIQSEEINDEDEIDDSESIQSENIAQICDGLNIIENCELNGVQYETYIYYPAREEKYHYETKITYVNKIVGYCTLCNDGTRSPSCSTGQGTCSHHGGVSEWNAPIYQEVAKKTEIKVIDFPYVEARYETVEKE